MITLEDCYGFCELSESEILAIATHEHIHEMQAIELAQQLLNSPIGPEKIHQMFIEDIAKAQANGKPFIARKLKATLAKFDQDYAIQSTLDSDTLSIVVKLN